jgi:AcrR family transcriptional regulator
MAKGDAPRKDRATPDEARERLINATIELLKTEPIPKVTTRRIAEVSGLSLMAIARNFGDQEGLFSAAFQELVRRHADEMELHPDAAELFEPNLVMRTKLLAWLLLTSANPKNFLPDESTPLMRRLEERQSLVTTASPRAQKALNELIAVAGEGFIIFNETHRFDENVLPDVVQLVSTIRTMLPDIEKRLGWTD